MDNAKSQLADKLKTANNILVTVSRNPSVDQLAACIGLTIVLNKQGKHAAAVFSGSVPSTIEFLKPEATLEKNTDSLRDFIIALDKSKADKLRYKVEDNVVRIFITPYKTSISQADLEFSQGDFNVDVVVALGVREQQDLDDAIMAHGRILHDATVSSINVIEGAEIGSINWTDTTASSLSELVTELVPLLGENLLDEQISTALLTGIVAETDRFSNEKTSPQTMSASAQLMATGANQQLVATKLEEPVTESKPLQTVTEDSSDEQKPDDGTLAIEHNQDSTTDKAPETKAATQSAEPIFELPPPVPISDDPVQESDAEPDEVPEPPMDPPSLTTGGPKLMTEAPTMGGQLTANSQPEGLDPSIDPLSMLGQQGAMLQHGTTQTVANTSTLDELLSHDDPSGGTGSSSQETAIVEPLATNLPPPPPVTDPVSTVITPTPQPAQPEPPKPRAPEPMIQGLTPPPPAWVPPSEDPFNTVGNGGDKTLSQLEQAVNSPHLVGENQLDDARDEVSRALNATAPAAGPIQALNAQPLGDALHPDSSLATPAAQPAPGFNAPLTINPLGSPTPPPDPTFPPVAPTPSPQVIDPNAPPPVPPPIPFQFGQ